MYQYRFTIIVFIIILNTPFSQFKDYFPPTELALSICPHLFVVSFLPPPPQFLIFSVMVKEDTPVIRVFIRHWRLENYLFTMRKSPANVQKATTIFHSDVEPFSKYSPVMLHLSPATRILNENPML